MKRHGVQGDKRDSRSLRCLRVCRVSLAERESVTNDLQRVGKAGGRRKEDFLPCHSIEQVCLQYRDQSISFRVRHCPDHPDLHQHTRIVMWAINALSSKSIAIHSCSLRQSKERSNARWTRLTVFYSGHWGTVRWQVKSHFHSLGDWSHPLH